MEFLSLARDLKAVLLSILKEMKRMTASIKQLHDAIGSQSDILNTFIADVQLLLSKVTVPDDVQGDLDKVNSTITALQAADASVKAAIAPVTGGEDTAPAGEGADTTEAGAGTDTSIPQE